MSWMKHTGCRYHIQETNYYCGAAAAMMILSEIGISYSNLDQDNLYTSNHSHNVKSGWYTDAYGLKYTLNDRAPSGYYFIVRKPISEAQGSRDIVYYLRKYGVSPAVLVFGCAHWIVVPGVQTDVEPVPGTSYTIEGFWIHNPVYYSSSPPPPHNATDACGSGGALGDANTFVTYNDWKNSYFTGCNYDDPSGNDQYISVCDPDERDIELPERREIKFMADGHSILASDQAIEFSEMGIREYNLFENERVKGLLENTKPSRPQTVLRLDRPYDFYQLVPYETGEGVAAYAKIDARYGVFQGLHLYEQSYQVKPLSRDEMMKRLFSRPIEMPEQRGRLPLFEEATSISPILVWRRCQESYSPFLPFYQLNYGPKTFYVRLDGVFFEKLTYDDLPGD